MERVSLSSIKSSNHQAQRKWRRRHSEQLPNERGGASVGVDLPIDCLSGVILPRLPPSSTSGPSQKPGPQLDLLLLEGAGLFPASLTLHGAPFPRMPLSSRVYRKKKNWLHLSSSMRPLPVSLERDACHCFRLHLNCNEKNNGSLRA